MTDTPLPDTAFAEIAMSFLSAHPTVTKAAADIQSHIGAAFAEAAKFAPIEPISYACSAITSLAMYEAFRDLTEQLENSGELSAESRARLMLSPMAYFVATVRMGDLA